MARQKYVQIAMLSPWRARPDFGDFPAWCAFQLPGWCSVLGPGAASDPSVGKLGNSHAYSSGGQDLVS